MKSKFLNVVTTVVFGYGVYAINYCRWIWFDEEVPARLKELVKDK